MTSAIPGGRQHIIHFSLQLPCQRNIRTHVVHLVRDELEPILPTLDARDHGCKARADNRLRVERLAERDALRGPLEALFDDATLRSERCADDHPPLVVEVAQDDLHALADRPEGVRDGGSRTVECDVGRACCRRVRGLDRLCGDRVLARDEDHNVPFLCIKSKVSMYLASRKREETDIRARGDGEVVGERAVRDPLLRAGDDPFVAVAFGVRLHAADIAAGEGLADGKTDELFAVEHLGDNLGLEFWRAEVEDGREADDLPCEQAVDIAPSAEAADLEVDDELQEG